VNARFKAQLQLWRARKRRMGDAAVGHAGESHAEQADRISVHLRELTDDLFVDHALDFGCGWGRFSELLSARCTHLWAADVFQDWVDRAVGIVPNATAVLMSDQRVRVDAGSMNAVFDIMTIQSIDNDTLAREAMCELRRISAPGATVISLHIVKPRSPTRTASQRAAHMGLSKWSETLLSNVDKTGAEYSCLIGTRV